MAQKKFSELEAGTVDGTSIFAQTKTEEGSLVSKSASSPALAGYIGTSHQFAGLSTEAKNLVGAINEAAQSGGASVIQLTQAEYTALSSAEKMNGSIYKLTDKAIFYCLDEEYHAVKELTSAQYEALTSAEQNNGTIYIKTDAETTGSDIPVSDTNATTIANKLDSLKIIKTGKANYTGLKGGGFADRVLVPVAFDSPMPNSAYVAFAMVNDAYNDFPFIRIYPFSKTATGFTAVCINQSGSQTAVGGSFDWVVIS